MSSNGAYSASAMGLMSRSTIKNMLRRPDLDDRDIERELKRTFAATGNALRIVKRRNESTISLFGTESRR